MLPYRHKCSESEILTSKQKPKDQNKNDYSKTKQLTSNLIFFKQEKSVLIHLLLKPQYAT